MRWLFWKRSEPRSPSDARPAAARPSDTACPTCGQEMHCIEKFTMSGDDLRTYRCDTCDYEVIVNQGMATWKAMSLGASGDG